MRILVLLLALAPLCAAAQAASLTLVCLDVGRMVEACQANASAFAGATGHAVRVVSAPSTNKQALEEYRALFAVESPRIDVLQFPDAWVPALAPDLVQIDTPAEPEPFIEAAREGALSDGRRVGWPQHVAITVLFFRSDLVDANAPFWSSMREQLVAAPNDGPRQVALGGADPALFSFFLDWFYGTGGERLDDREAVTRALTLLAEFLGPVAAPGTAQMPVGEATQSFADGETAALIARSTQSTDERASELSDKIDATPMPALRAGPQDAAVLVTTWYVGTSRHSREVDAARDLAAYLASEPVQRDNALTYGLAPTRSDLYADPEVVATGPLFAQLGGLIGRLKGPPTRLFGPSYLDLVDTITENVRALLIGDSDVETVTHQIERAVLRANRLRTN